MSVTTIRPDTDAPEGSAEYRVTAALKLHSQFRIYGECEHRHTSEDIDAGRALDIENVGVTCKDGLEKVACLECCTGGSGYQSEECAAEHLGQCWPCPTARVLGVPSSDRSPDEQ